MTTATDDLDRQDRDIQASTCSGSGVEFVWYVYVRNGHRTGLLAGPFAHQRIADTYVDPARTLAESFDRWAHFYEFGSLRARPRPGRAVRPGRLNVQLGLPNSVMRVDASADTHQNH